MREAEDLEGVQRARSLGFDQRSIFLSDTIAIACFDDKQPSRAVSAALAFAGLALHEGGADNAYGGRHRVQLAYRGAISFGPLHIEDRYLIGEAVDEAAEWMDRAQGAFVFLTESARAVHAPPPDDVPLATRWRVPVRKAMGSYNIVEIETCAASPFPHGGGPLDGAHEVGDLILKTFDRAGSENAHVVEMRANTKRFLDHACAEWLAFRRANPDWPPTSG